MIQQQTMVRFMTRLGIKGNLAYRHSQVKKATMVIPPTTNMAIRDPDNAVTLDEPRKLSPYLPLTVLVPMIGACSETEWQEDQREGEAEEDQAETINPSPIKDHPRPDGLGSVLALDLLLETEVRGSDRDG